MHKLIIRLKSGYEIPITCEDFTFEENRLSGELTNYEIKGIKDNVPLYFRITDVDCVVENMDGTADRPQGEWIKDNLGTVICSECKRPRRDNRVNHINFCNSCGARMKGADDE